MNRQLLLGAVIAAAICLPLPGLAAVVNICNGGNVNVSVAVAIYSKSFLAW